MIQSIPNEVIDWLSFEFFDKSESGKTEIWSIIHKDSREELGEIIWNPQWRQYWAVFVDAGMTKGCLESCAQFLGKLMEAHKAK